MKEPYTEEFKAQLRQAFPGITIDEDEEKAQADLLKPDPEEAEATLKEYGVEVRGQRANAVLVDEHQEV